MSSEVIEKGLSRLAYQFKESLKLKSFLESFLQEFEELSTSGLQLLNERYIDTAYGMQLDGIGGIVGIERPIGYQDIIGAFGFLTDTTARGFGDLFNMDLGGNFADYNSVYSLVGDDIYRTLIRMKIIINQTAMTVDDTLNLISFMFGGVEVRYYLFTNLNPIYAIGTILTPLEDFLMDNIPVLIGLENVTYYLFYDKDAFSFDGDITGLGFGDINDPVLGGNFAKLYI